MLDPRVLQLKAKAADLMIEGEAANSALNKFKDKLDEVCTTQTPCGLLTHSATQRSL
jgi:hypothetical protein